MHRQIDSASRLHCTSCETECSALASYPGFATAVLQPHPQAPPREKLPTNDSSRVGSFSSGGPWGRGSQSNGWWVKCYHVMISSYIFRVFLFYMFFYFFIWRTLITAQPSYATRVNTVVWRLDKVQILFQKSD